MKRLCIVALILVCISGYSQPKNLPMEVVTAFQEKYLGARAGDWWVENQLYQV